MANWADVNNWDSAGDLTTRVRRLERGEQYLRAGQLVTPSGAYAGVPTSLLDGNRIDLTSTDLSTKGSIPPFGVVGNFGFSSTTTSITIYWDGTNSSVKLHIVRADGSAISIPGSSLTVSGLTATTTYAFLPFWSVFNNCGIGFVKGDSGSPQFAFSAAAKTVQASIQQSYQGREPLSPGFITFATQTTGTGSGTGGSGGTGSGPGTCIMLGSDIEPMGDGGYVTRHYKQTDWLNVAVDDYPRSLNCTPNHPLYHPESGKRRADQFTAGDWIITEQGERRVKQVKPFRRLCTKVEVQMPSGHLYFANGFLSHNVKYREEL
jgi:hypothetical protein